MPIIKKTFTIKDLGGGWYSFADIPQKTYIKIDALRYSSIDKAMKQGSSILKANNLPANSNEQITLLVN